MGRQSNVHVMGKDLAFTKRILEEVGQKNGPSVRMRIARMITKVDKTKEHYDYAVKPTERFVEFTAKRRGVYEQYGEMKTNGVEVAPEYADAFHMAMADLKLDYKQDIEVEYNRALQVREVDNAENDLGIPRASIRPSWIKDCDTSHIAFLVSNGFVDEEEFDSYLEESLTEE
jgi:hypothetical protein